MKSDSYRRINILEKKVEMLEEYMNEVSNYVASMKHDAREKQETLVSTISESSREIKKRMEYLEERLHEKKHGEDI